MERGYDKTLYWRVRRGAQRHTNVGIVILSVPRLRLRGKGPLCGVIASTSDPRRHWPFGHVARSSGASDKPLPATESTPRQIFYPPSRLSTLRRAQIATPARITARSSPVACSLHLKIFSFTVPWLSSSVCLTEQLARLCSQIFVWQLTNTSVAKLISYKQALILL